MSITTTTRAYKWAERRKIERHPTTGPCSLSRCERAEEEIFKPKEVAAYAAFNKVRDPPFRQSAQVRTDGLWPEEW